MKRKVRCADCNKDITDKAKYSDENGAVCGECNEKK